MRFSRATAVASLTVALLAASVSAPASAAPTLHTPKSATFSVSQSIRATGFKPMFGYGCFIWIGWNCG